MGELSVWNPSENTDTKLSEISILMDHVIVLHRSRYKYSDSPTILSIDRKNLFYTFVPSGFPFSAINESRRDATLRIGNGWTCCNKKLFTRNSMEPRWRFYEPLQPLLSHEIRKMSKTSASSTARYKETEASLHYSKLSTTPHCLPFPDPLMKKISSSRPNYSRWYIVSLTGFMNS